jgi:hypothetical protein
MKYALIKNNIVELISYQQTEGFVEVSDNVFADMIRKPDGSFNYSDEFLAEQEQFRQEELAKKQAKIDAKASALVKLTALGLTQEEILSILK